MNRLIESLETRRLLSAAIDTTLAPPPHHPVPHFAFLHKGLLTVNGTGAADKIKMKLDSPNGADQLDVTVDGHTQTFNADDVKDRRQRWRWQR